ncbi:MAG: Aminomethyltransferase [Candidatus Omnitrophica bacterium ADurb.Bin277]|nr:MAG: Aminomethyltransferase [Candidatus Omnitrophica bacterium ADurb.Bin277]
MPKDKLKSVWDAVLRAGPKRGLKPIGFGARDTLRLEAAMPLYGHELDDEITPFEAGLGWAIDLTKPVFPGQPVLKKQKEEGVARKRIGFEMTGRGIPRHGCEVQKNGTRIGWVTSGSFIPVAGGSGRNLGMAYVSFSEAAEGSEIDIIIRGNPAKARIVSLPFYKRK